MKILNISIFFIIPAVVLMGFQNCDTGFELTADLENKSIAELNEQLKQCKSIPNAEGFSNTCGTSYIFYNGVILTEANLKEFIILSENYSRSGPNIYYKNMPLYNVDLATFQVIGLNFAKDIQNIYFGDQIIYGANLNTFTPLSTYYSKDQNSYYYIDQKIGLDTSNFNLLSARHWTDGNKVYLGSNEITGADLNTFTNLNDEFSKDSSHVYRLNRILPGADPLTFQPIGTYYSKDSTQVFGSFTPIQGILSNSFQLIQEGYAKDANTVYLYGTPILGADPNTFTILSSPYAKDKNNIYFYRQPLQNASLNDYEVIDNGRFFKSNGNIYSFGQIVPNADADSFVVIGGNFAKDKNTAYYGADPFSEIPPAELKVHSSQFASGAGKLFCALSGIIDVDTANLKQLNSVYVANDAYIFRRNGTSCVTENRPPNIAPLALDSETLVIGSLVFKYAGLVVGIDGLTFKMIGMGYGLDKDNVYFLDRALVNANPDTFSLIFNSQGQFSNFTTDGTNYYYAGTNLTQVGGVDFSNFTLISDYYARSNTQVFRGDSIINGADVNSFQVLSPWYAKDQANVYYLSSVLVGANSNSFKLANDFWSADDDQVFFRNYSTPATVDFNSFVSNSYSQAEDVNNIYVFDDITQTFTITQK